jgi:hypothetical protein
VRKWWKVVGGVLFVLLGVIRGIVDAIGEVQTASDLPVLKWVMGRYFPLAAFAAATLLGSWAYYDYRIKKEPAGFVGTPENKRRFRTQAIVGALAVLAVCVFTPLIYSHYRHAASAETSSASQGVTVQKVASTQGVQSATPTQPSVAQKRTTSGKAKRGTVQPAQQTALRESLSKKDAQEATPQAQQDVSTLSRDCSSPGTIASNSIYRTGATPHLSGCDSLTNSLVQGPTYNGARPTFTVAGQNPTLTRNTIVDTDIRDTAKESQYNGNLIGSTDGVVKVIQASNRNTGADMDEIYAAQTQNVYECHSRECCGSTPFPDTPISGFDASLTAVAINGEKKSAVADELAQILKKGRKVKGVDSEKDWEVEVKAFLTPKLGSQFAKAFDHVQDKMDTLIMFENQLRAACD